MKSAHAVLSFCTYKTSISLYISRTTTPGNRKTWLALIVGLVCISVARPAYSQAGGGDTLNITLKDAENRFLAKNMSLILSNYHVEQAKAEILTARLFNNPEISYENIFYNPDNRKYFETNSETGQMQAQLSQLFRMAGKRNKSIRLSRAGLQVSENQFYDLMRTLRYTLRTNFYTLYYKNLSAGVYNQQINALQQSLKVFKEQYQKGNIAEREIIRIQSLLYSLQSERTQLLNEREEMLSDLRQLIQVPAGTTLVPLIQGSTAETLPLSNITFPALLDSALLNRADLKAARSGIEYAAADLSLQKALAVPDLTVSAAYDLQGSYIKHYTGLGISFPIALFNRNQGGIKQASLALDASRTAALQQRQIVENEVTASYKKALRLEETFSEMDAGFADRFNQLIGEVNSNYQKRNIGLLEFLDLYDSYKENVIQVNELKLNRINAFEELNYVTGIAIFNK